MWPFRRKTDRVEVFRGESLSIFFTMNPRTGMVRFPLQEKEKVSMTWQDEAEGARSLTVIFSPADEVVHDLLLTARQVEVVHKGEVICRLPIMTIITDRGHIAVLANDEELRRVP